MQVVTGCPGTKTYLNPIEAAWLESKWLTEQHLPPWPARSWDHNPRGREGGEGGEGRGGEGRGGEGGREGMERGKTSEGEREMGGSLRVVVVLK